MGLIERGECLRCHRTRPHQYGASVCQDCEIAATREGEGGPPEAGQMTAKVDAMKWDYATNDPWIIGAGYRILLDGERIRKVRAFDTEEGWILALCLDDHTGHGGQIHLDPQDPSEVCETLLHGLVTVVAG